MTPNRRRIALASACPTKIRIFDEFWRFHDGKCWHDCKDNDPLSDLNAMHAAEKVLTVAQQKEYGYQIEAVCCPREYGWRATADQLAEAFLHGYQIEAVCCPREYGWRATADQLAEAFLKTLGLWQGTK